MKLRTLPVSHTQVKSDDCIGPLYQVLSACEPDRKGATVSIAAIQVFFCLCSSLIRARFVITGVTIRAALSLPCRPARQ